LKIIHNFLKRREGVEKKWYYKEFECKRFVKDFI
jgi:hypothetical protein